MTLTIDTGAILHNWRTLAERAGTRTAAVVKADAYGLGAGPVMRALAAAGCAEAFVFTAAEARALRADFGGRIFVLEGHAAGADLGDAIPCIVSPEQFFRDRATRPGRPFTVQIDTGMSRLGFTPDEWRALRAEVLAARPLLLMSHFVGADDPDQTETARQLALFTDLTAGSGVPRSLSATAGVLWRPQASFDLARPGVGLFGGAEFAGARAVVRLALPVLQVRRIAAGERVGYGGSWTAARPSRIATVQGGYADGIFRSLGGAGLTLGADGGRRVPVVGRVSMDTLTVDVTDIGEVPPALTLLDADQDLSAVAGLAGTISYEVLTSLGRRWPRRYI